MRPIAPLPPGIDARLRMLAAALHAANEAVTKVRDGSDLEWLAHVVAQFDVAAIHLAALRKTTAK
jgi:hypothetical protein